ncbi:MAG: AsnC family transcriptional regulator [Pseudomonadota bacterium]
MTDAIDEMILEELRRNRRIPLTELSRKVGRSRTAIEARIKKLENTRRILGYTIEEPSEQVTDQMGSIILVAMEVRKHGDRLLKAFLAMPEIANCVWVTGEYDFALFVKPIPSADLLTLIEQVYTFEGVKRTETLMALKTAY